jgi:hypothetical protein
VDFALFNIPRIAKSLDCRQRSEARRCSGADLAAHAKDHTSEEEIKGSTNAASSEWKVCWQTTMSTARVLNSAFILRRTTWDVFEGGLEGMVRALISIGFFEKLQSLVVSSSEFDPHREKVAEEMLLCEVINQSGHAESVSQSAYEGAMQQDGEASLGAAAADRPFDIQADMFRCIAT